MQASALQQSHQLAVAARCLQSCTGFLQVHCVGPLNEAQQRASIAHRKHGLHSGPGLSPHAVGSDFCQQILLCAHGLNMGSTGPACITFSTDMMHDEHQQLCINSQLSLLFVVQV